MANQVIPMVMAVVTTILAQTRTITRAELPANISVNPGGIVFLLSVLM
jgi:hypothetical protein